MHRDETQNHESAGWSAILISSVGSAVLLGLCIYIGDYDPILSWIGILAAVILPWLVIAAIIYFVLRLCGIRPKFGPNRNKK